MVCSTGQRQKYSMSNTVIKINNLSFNLPHKDCFSDFSTCVQRGEKIGIIGRNGIGKSSLLKIILGELSPSSGEVSSMRSVSIAYVPQIVMEYEDISGGERFNKSFSKALARNPDVLILDEPTNHLDQKNRHSLMRMLSNFRQTLLVATHDTEFLDRCINKLWHIDNGKIVIFNGNYENYMREHHISIETKEREFDNLKKAEKKIKKAKEAEQQRSEKKSKLRPKDNNSLSFGFRKDRGQTVSGAKIGLLKQKINNIQSALDEYKPQEILTPNFILKGCMASSSRSILSISDGKCGYTTAVVSGISLCMSGNDKISISGNNGSGKTTFIKALLKYEEVWTNGTWTIPNRSDIGYIDQYYRTLDPEKSAEDIIYEKNPNLGYMNIRKHLNSFMFRKNEEVSAKVKTMSGGEMARLSLAQIAVNPPKLLILDEITNNLDIETKDHISKILQQYPGAFIIISHELEFLSKLPLTGHYAIIDGRFTNVPSL